MLQSINRLRKFFCVHHKEAGASDRRILKKARAAPRIRRFNESFIIRDAQYVDMLPLLGERIRQAECHEEDGQRDGQKDGKADRAVAKRKLTARPVSLN
jgi:hypothetical protein